MKVLSLFVAVVVTLGLASSVEAKSKKKSFMSKSAGTKGSYGMAGCGLGSILFKEKNDKMSQILAATTNGTSGNQTFGITTGTLECTDDGTMSFSQMKQNFMEANQDKLIAEMAQGNGEYLTVLAAFYGCRGSKAADFGALTQRNFDAVVGAANHVEMMKSVDSMVAKSALANNCGA